MKYAGAVMAAFLTSRCRWSVGRGHGQQADTRAFDNTIQGRGLGGPCDKELWEGVRDGVTGERTEETKYMT